MAIFDRGLAEADFCLVSGTAVMFLPEARYGMFPSGGMSILLGERCGAARAAELMWLGEHVDAKALVSLGIATNIFPTWQLEEQALVLAQRLANLPAESRSRYKLARSRDIADRLERALQFEARCCVQAGMNADTRLRMAASSVFAKA